MGDPESGKLAVSMGHAGGANKLIEVVDHVEVERRASLAHDPARQAEPIAFLEMAGEAPAAEGEQA